jgi:hypothetical protein
LDYEGLLAEQNWFCQRGLSMVVSPDFDGLLCALLMNSHLGWQLCGFYDGKALALCHPVNHICELVFLDVEIYRPSVRSIGNHLLQWSSRTPLPNFQRTINPNLLRGITAYKEEEEFQRKYPFGTSHFLLALLAHSGVELRLPTTNKLLTILLYPDGTHRVLLNYRSNVMDWLKWMDVKSSQKPISQLFQALVTMPLAEIVHGLEWLSGQLKEIGFAGKDDPCRFDPTDTDEYEKAQTLWQFLQQVTSLQSPPIPQISWVARFETKTEALRAEIYRRVLSQNPLSFALTSRARKKGFQYTLVPPCWQWLTD